MSVTLDSLLLRIVVTPALIGAASLAGRRWGQAVSGWLVGLPQLPRLGVAAAFVAAIAVAVAVQAGSLAVVLRSPAPGGGVSGEAGSQRRARRNTRKYW